MVLKNTIHKTSDHFLIEYVVFVLILKNDIKNEKFHFAPNLCEIRKEMLKNKEVNFKNDLQIRS